jgi:ubiquinone/menaquinone biosynthesis C-methylase UbiE
MRRLMRVFYHHFYHDFAWTYNFISAMVSIGRWRDWGRVCLPYLQAGTVLEIGFGTGQLQLELNRRLFHSFGLDESRQMCALAWENLARNGFSHCLARGAAQYIPFASQTFGNVVANFPSDYILNNQTLTEVWRVLRPGGRLIVTPMAWINGKSLADRAAKWLFRVSGQTQEPKENFGDRLETALVDAGFQVEIIPIETRQSTVLVLVAQKAIDRNQRH